LAGKRTLRCPTAGLARPSPAMLPTSSAGRNRHQPASNVLVPADIQGSDVVAEEQPFGLSSTFANLKL
jgi:hypothetical protein